MLRVVVRSLQSVVLCGTLAACGGGVDVPTEPPLTYAQRSDANNAMVDRLDVLFNSKYTAVPIIGSATYDGYAVFKHADTVDDGIDTDAQLIGDARITANFSSGTVTGQATNIAGWHAGKDVGDYAGTVTLSNGVIGVNRPNDLAANFGGTLTRDGDTLVLSGSALGDFKGTPIAGVMMNVDPASTLTINGVDPLLLIGGIHGER